MRLIGHGLQIATDAGRRTKCVRRRFDVRHNAAKLELTEERAMGPAREGIEPGSGQKPTLSLSLAELVKIAIDLWKFVMTIWSLFFTSCLAVVGWLVTIKVSLSPEIRWTAIVIVMLLSAAFCFGFELQYGKINRIYELIRSHPELDEMRPEFRQPIDRFAARIVGCTNRVFLPVGMIALLVFIWTIGG
jgi:hypothetical protein